MRPIGRLHLITDHRPGRDAVATVSAAIAGGVDTVQIRVPDETTDRDAYGLGLQVLELCRAHDVTCLVNDRLHIALAIGADGGHVGADDLPVSAARKVLGPRAIVGATARDPEGARRAAADGASYLGVGPTYLTTTKAGLPAPIGLAGLRAVADATDLPVIAIGGITTEYVPQVRDAGAHGVAVVRAINAASDPRAVAGALRSAWTRR